MNNQVKIKSIEETVMIKSANHLSQLWRLLRPNQWIKNSFVFLGIIFSNSWYHSEVLFQACLAALAFCLCSSAVYAFNDIVDCDRDRLHPVKKLRPVAAGHISKRFAWAIAITLAIAGVFIGGLVSFTTMFLLLAYFLQNIAYSKVLKHIVILDVFTIAVGFMLRIFVGTWGIGINPSPWLLVCSFMITLFMGFGKRWAELSDSEKISKNFRTVLGFYNIKLLNQFTGITAAGAIITYSLYTLDSSTMQVHHTQSLVLTIPFVVYGIFRYIYLIHSGQGGDPSKLVAKDRHIIITVFLWLGTVLWLLN